ASTPGPGDRRSARRGRPRRAREKASACAQATPTPRGRAVRRSRTNLYESVTKEVSGGDTWGQGTGRAGARKRGRNLIEGSGVGARRTGRVGGGRGGGRSPAGHLAGERGTPGEGDAVPGPGRGGPSRGGPRRPRRLGRLPGHRARRVRLARLRGAAGRHLP